MKWVKQARLVRGVEVWRAEILGVQFTAQPFTLGPPGAEVRRYLVRAHWHRLPGQTRMSATVTSIAQSLADAGEWAQRWMLEQVGRMA